MELKGTDRAGLLDYLCRQLDAFFPDGGVVRGEIDHHLDEGLARVGQCIDGVRVWRQGSFDYLHSTQYTIFLYYLANSIWRAGGDLRVCTKLFYLNKTLNGIDMFYEIEMPKVFFIGHSVGIVLAKATYGEYLVLYQNSTVGKNHGVSPVLGEGVILYPNTAVIGRCQIGDRSFISQGVSVINADTPGNCCVYQGSAGSLAFKPPKHDILSDFFRF
ncbi:hypothetical protein [Aquipseudomonas alcaligenes]|uniref:Serine O-acetyltransferase n=1 Tax=Aquipseudomonas alcaligenes TaxID=43263 RepID=A0AB73HUM4_AQUAC|nr:hypothetical protein [Pseudomonas alcaligenes]MDH0141538.1 hypothetical protein [Pseudomonas alcaligenes]